MERLNVGNNCNWRGDCPACGGGNSFSVSNNFGRLIWYCFRDSCKIKGIKTSEIDLSSAQKHLMSEAAPKMLKPTPIKDFLGWDNIKLYPEAMDYLLRNNCMDAYNLEPHRFFYDKIEDRVVFVSYDTPNAVKLATGRKLKPSFGPKWYKYVALPGEYYESPSFIGGTDTIFIVEDCASACSLSRLDYSLALCGTSYNLYGLINKLSHAEKRIVICLDKDAQISALKLQVELKASSSIKEIVIKQLSDDAKNLSLEELKKELNYG